MTYVTDLPHTQSGTDADEIVVLEHDSDTPCPPLDAPKWALPLLSLPTQLTTLTTDTTAHAHSLTTQLQALTTQVNNNTAQVRSLAEQVDRLAIRMQNAPVYQPEVQDLAAHTRELTDKVQNDTLVTREITAQAAAFAEHVRRLVQKLGVVTPVEKTVNVGDCRVEMDTTNMTALVLGGTGAVGMALVRQLLEREVYGHVVTIGRREVEFDGTVPTDRLTQKVINFENLEQHRDAFRGADVVFCCLGTTLAVAGSAAQFFRIDRDYVVQSARIIAQENPAKDEGRLSPVHYLYCSSVFAKKNSHLLHPQSKGLTEEDLSHSGFTRVTHFRPGFLETEHDRPTPRFIEGIALSIIRGLGLSSLSNPVATVGRAMINVSDGTASFIQYNRNDAGTEIAFVGNGQIKDIGRALGGEKVAETEALAPGNFRGGGVLAFELIWSCVEFSICSSI
ncbi:hypothetical protein BC936DRAFT_148192 [Jimgerdemannia flammicorona]|uniref:Semialdehyde dehydrogenase NAD-binding domain-containing protein n=1 Tax=Jimgerdemannia flammicorona TaxID=994334 RepID=A0A433D3L0_9FUNG|nr:hypothetical protein BC936DRAFT_148192 [Jimgerdemannia flammicorona]